MSFAEVKNLRKAGQLEEAFALAQTDLNAAPEDIWAKRSMGWVLYEQLKNAAQNEQFESGEQILDAIAELRLPAEEAMFWDSIGWQVGKIAFALQKHNPINFPGLDRLFQRIAPLPFHRPSEPYSFLLKAFLKSNKEWMRFTDFVEWWGLEHLRTEDYVPELLPDGKKSMTLAEQVAIAYARKLAEPPADRERIDAFLPLLDRLIQEHPEYQYPPYYKGKLLLANGDKENVFSAFLPFARKKQTEFWVWELLAETFPTTDARYAACLCRALLCRAEPQFLGKVRAKLAEWLLANSHPAEAKTEMEAIAAVYQAEGWRLPAEVQARMQQDWYRQTTALPDNRALYQQFQDLAEEILFGDAPEELIVAEFVNRDKDVLNFVGEDGKHGSLKYGKRLRNVRTGDLFLVRFNGEGRDDRYQIFTIQPAPKETTSGLRRSFEGVLSIRNGQPFGFVDDVFVEPEMVQKNLLHNGQRLHGDCILSWNKKQGKMAWKAINLQLIQTQQ